MRHVSTTTMLCMGAVLFAGWAAADPILVEDGTPKAAIVLPEEPHEREQIAADELVKHIELISGVELPVIAQGETPPAGAVAVRIGHAADEALEDLILAEGDSYSSFALIVDGDGVSIRGLNPEGAQFGVYELLEQLGVRWFMPIELGAVIPESDTIRLERQETIQVPSMDYRRLQQSRWSAPDEWFQRNRMGGEARSTGSHGIPPFRRNRDLFESNPEYFALIDGEREFRQICASNPGAVNETVNWIRDNYEATEDSIYIGMGPNDGEGYCECEDCSTLDGDVYDPLYGMTSVTGRYIWFFNEVLDALEDEYPNLRLAWYVYARHMMPPPPELDPNPRIVHVFAPITLDRTRGMDNPMSPDRHVLRHIVDGWAERGPEEMYYRGYYNNLACPQFPFSQIDRLRNEVPALHERGVNVMRVEVIYQSWASTPITPYLALRRMWDVDGDMDALLDDFYEKFFGPAAGAMGRYFEDLEAAFRDTPYKTGSSYLYFPIFDQQRRDALRGAIERGAELAEAEAGADSDYARRIHMIGQGFERMELFLDMIAARNAHDFQTAHELVEAYIELTDAMIDKEWVVSREADGGGYFGRFFRQPIASGHHRTVEAGDLVKGLPDEWDFLIDPAEIGELAGYYRAGELGGNWQRLKTSSRSWSDQGLHYYTGDAWYRAHVTIPEECEGREIYLWFGGVDNEAKVWVNGQLLGTNREPLHGLPGEAGTFRPFEFLATEAVRFGEENTVTAKTTNDRLAELGTGGIVAPVMFWSPHDPDWTPEN